MASQVERGSCPALVLMIRLMGYPNLDRTTAGIKNSLQTSLWFSPLGLILALLWFGLMALRPWGCYSGCW